MAKLTAKTRNALPDSDFAVSGRRFPVEDRNHAVNALARASQFHPELKAKIRAKVHKKFPDIGMKMDGGSVKARGDRPCRK